MTRFLGKTVFISTCFGGIEGSGAAYKGEVTAVDDEFIVLDEKVFVVRKYILSIKIKEKKF